MDDSEALQPTGVSGDGTMSRQGPQPLRSVPIEQMKGQVQDIQTLMNDLMEEDEHYGVIPGTGDKPTLLQPGAEKLCFAFQMAPDYTIERTDIDREDVPAGHREYEVRCTLTHRNSGMNLGQGVGSCSTLESKYRYRYVDETTEVGIPSDFWDSYEDSMANADFSILEEELVANGVDIPDGGEAGVIKNDDGEWRITVKAKSENPDIADVYNTVLKMAKKRALVDAVKTATAASDIFTQDVEDLAQLDGSSVKGQRERQPETQQSGSEQRTVNRYGHTVTPNQAESIDQWSDRLKETDDLPAAILYIEDHIEDELTDEEFIGAMQGLLDKHRQRLADQEPQAAEEAAAKNDDFPGKDKYDGTQEALNANFDKAWRTEQNSGWDSISEAQLNRLYAIAEEEGWKESALNRMIKDELGWDSKADVPYGDPYDEICEALEDDRLRYYMSRDPDTRDMFEGDDSGSEETSEEDEPNHESFEDGAQDDDLPF